MNWWSKKKDLPDHTILAAFAVMDEDNPQWKALNAVIERQVRIELDTMLVPNLTDSAAQYNRGRVAALESLKETLQQIWERSQQA